MSSCSPCGTNEQYCQFLSTPNRTHTVLEHFRPDDHESIVCLKGCLAAAGGSEKEIGKVFEEYVSQSLSAAPINWTNVFDYLKIAKAFMQEPQDSQINMVGTMLEGLCYSFIQERKSKDTCPEDRYDCDALYKKLEGDGTITVDKTLLEKTLHPGKRDATYIVGAVWRRGKQKVAEKLDLPLVDSRFLNGTVFTKEVAGAPKGFHVYKPMLDKEELGTLIIGNPKEGAKVAMEVELRGEVTNAEIEDKYNRSGKKLMYHGTLAMQSDYGTPLGSLMIDGNNGFQFRFKANSLFGMIVLFRDGRFRIIDRSNFRKSDITGNEADNSIMLSTTDGEGTVFSTTSLLFRLLKEQHASMLMNVVFDPEGDLKGGRATQFSKTRGDSNRRLLFTFKDGSFGVYDTNDLGLNEMLAVLYNLQSQFGPLDHVAMCDRGMFDSAMYYINGKKQTLSDSSPPMNRIVFYSEEK